MSRTDLSARLTILDVGHGNSAVLTDEGVTVVFDAGRRSGLLEFLKQQGVTRVDTVLVSHADRDHIDGLIAILSCGEFALGRIRLNTDSLKDSDVWDDLLFELNELSKKGKVDFSVSLTANSSEDFSTKTVGVEVLAPSTYLAGKGPGSTDRSGRAITSNSVSAVVRLVVNGRPVVLFTGDLDDTGLENLIADETEIQAAVLVFPHHGGRSGTRGIKQFAEKLIRRVSPSTVIFSIGRGVRSNPRPEVIGVVRQFASGASIACTQLSERCSAKVAGVPVDHLAGVFSQGAEAGICCAGSMKIDLAKGELNRAQAEQHREFVIAKVPEPMCRV